jgi:hypothetical protein
MRCEGREDNSGVCEGRMTILPRAVGVVNRFASESNNFGFE